MVDQQLIQRKFLLLKGSLDSLQKWKIPSLGAFKQNMMARKAIEKVLQEMVEICMDIGKHIIADEKLGVPRDSKEIFQILFENKYIPEALTKTMIKMVGFRNVIIHLYEKIDPEVVYSAYRKNLKDFSAFMKEIQKRI